MPITINAWSPTVLAGALGIILIIWGIMTKGAKQRKKLFTFGLPIFGVALIVILMGANLPTSMQFLNDNLFGGTHTKTYGDVTVTYATSGQTQQPSGGGGLCAVEDTTVTLSSMDKYLATPTGGGHRYRINGAPALSLADTGTFTASPGDSIQILWNNATATGYYGIVETKTIPCSGTVTYSASSVNNGSLSMRVFNEEGNLIDTTETASENETLGAGDVVNLKMELQGQYQREFPYGLVMVLEYNKSAIDDVVISLGGSTLQAGNVPVSFSPAYGTDSVRKAYLVPPVISNTLYSGTVMIDADDTANPSVEQSGDIAITFYALNYYSNKYKGGAFEGPSVEDVDNSVTRTGVYLTNIAVD